MYPSPRDAIYGTFVQEHIEAARRLGFHMDVFFTDARGHRARYAGDIPRLIAKLRTGGYDVVHAHHTYSVFQAAFSRMILRARTPLLFTFHEGEANLPPGFRDTSADLVKRLVYSKRLKRLALDLSDCCITVEARLPRSVGYGGEYFVIPPGVDTTLFRPLDPVACRRRLGFRADERVVFFPADPSRLLKGADLFERSLRSVETAVRVVYGGAILRHEMPIYMNAADVVVQTSRYEASPTVVKEAMACNKLVVSTDVGDVADLFAATPGCFCTQADERSVARAIETALRFGAPPRGRERVLTLGLSTEVVAERYAEKYQRLAAASRSRRQIRGEEGTERNRGVAPSTADAGGRRRA
jgi:teichuronic acid biosynthesis glycosyltransferase TuaC